MIRNVFDLARHFGVDDSGNETTVEARLDRAIYKGTDCGAHIRCWHDAVVLSCIVEGSDAEFMESLRYPFTETAFDSKLDYLEDQCDYEWHRANEEDDFED